MFDLADLTLASLVNTQGDEEITHRVAAIVDPVRAEAREGAYIRTPTARKAHVLHPRTQVLADGIGRWYIWTLCGQVWQRDNVTFANLVDADAICGLCSR